MTEASDTYVVPPIDPDECGVESCEAPMTWDDNGKQVCPKCGWAP